jgi:SAM-dependent methyltransferase
MKNAHLWTETKVVRVKDRFAPSSNAGVLGIGSRVAASCQISHYYAAIQDHAQGRLLDLGCGHVPYYEMYRSLTTETICVDWENTLHKNELLDDVVDINKPLPMESDSFDTVLLMDVLEHIAHPLELVGEISRVLRPGGKLIVGVPFFYWLHEQPYDFFRYTEFALARLCESNALHVVSLEPYGGVPEILADVTGKCVCALGKAPGSAYVSVCQMILATRIVRSMSRRTNRLFPFGYTLVARK